MLTFAMFIRQASGTNAWMDRITYLAAASYEIESENMGFPLLITLVMFHSLQKPDALWST